MREADNVLRLQFPKDDIVGELDWPGCDDVLVPVLATGVVEVWPSPRQPDTYLCGLKLLHPEA